MHVYQFLLFRLCTIYSLMLTGQRSKVNKGSKRLIYLSNVVCRPESLQLGFRFYLVLVNVVETWNQSSLILYIFGYWFTVGEVGALNKCLSNYGHAVSTVFIHCERPFGYHELLIWYSVFCDYGQFL